MSKTAESSPHPRQPGLESRTMIQYLIPSVLLKIKLTEVVVLRVTFKEEALHQWEKL